MEIRRWGQGGEFLLRPLIECIKIYKTIFFKSDTCKTYRIIIVHSINSQIFKYGILNYVWILLRRIFRWNWAGVLCSAEICTMEFCATEFHWNAIPGKCFDIIPCNSRKFISTEFFWTPWFQPIRAQRMSEFFPIVQLLMYNFKL